MKQLLKSIGVSPGIAIGKALVVIKNEIVIIKEPIDKEKSQIEFSRFNDALSLTHSQISEILDKARVNLGEDKAGIFEAQLDVLADPSLIDSMKEKIYDRLMNADWALKEAVDEICALFEAIDDEYLKERAADVRDVCGRVAQNLAGNKIIDMSNLADEVIIIAKDLLPSDTATMDLKRVLGFATDLGGRTSHTSIIARSLEIPAVVGLGTVSDIVKDGDTLVLDGLEGIVIINPDEDELSTYMQKQKAYREEKQELLKLKELPAKTLDDKVVELCANIGGANDCDGANNIGAEGIGLFRTEFLYMNSKTSFPSEDAQFAAYKEVAEKMKGKPVIVRTLDIGGDKELPYYEFDKEINPFLGYRAIRMCLDKTDIFKTQLRAILKASAFGKLKIMFPMIISVEEFTNSKQILQECMDELKNDGVSYDENIEVGIMVETPAAVVIAEHFAKIVDFFSIGTNDLTQYTLAVDRGNEKIAHLYNSFHPAVISSIKKVIDASHENGKWTGMCGEFAGEEKAALLLLGMGLDEFSMSAISIPYVKKIIRNVTYDNARKIADEALSKSTTSEVVEVLDKALETLKSNA